MRTLPVHELKIDRSFITLVDQQPKSAAIVRSTIVLCRELGLSVVAEGVETASELKWLQVNRCDLAQGFGIGRPMPVHELYDWLAITLAGLAGTVAEVAGRPALPVERDGKTV